MSREKLADLAQPVATLLVAASVTVLALVEIGIIPSTRITTKVSGGSSGGFSKYDTLDVRLVDLPNIYVNGEVGVKNNARESLWISGLSCNRY